MNKQKQLAPLGAIPYYGGKAKMAYLIAEMLDYDNTDIFVEPFGGGARVLLNKKRHKHEIYFDLSLCVYALFKILTDKALTQQLIEKILETDCTEEAFYEFKEKFDFCEANYLELLINEIDMRTKCIVTDRSVREAIKTGKLTDVNTLFNFRLNGFCCNEFLDESEYRFLNGLHLELMMDGKRGRTSKKLDDMSNEVIVNREGATVFKVLGRTLNLAYDEHYDNVHDVYDAYGLGDFNYLTKHLEEIHAVDNNIKADGIIELIKVLNLCLGLYLTREDEDSEFKYKSFQVAVDKYISDAESEAKFWLDRYAERNEISEDELAKGLAYYKELTDWKESQSRDEEEANRLSTYDLFVKKIDKWKRAYERDIDRNKKSNKNYNMNLETYKEEVFERIKVFFERYYDGDKQLEGKYEECVSYYEKLCQWKEEYAKINNLDIEQLDRFYNIHREHEKKRILLILDKARQSFCENQQGYTNYEYDKSLNNINLVDIALCAYVVYKQSYDGIGRKYNQGIYKFADDFHKSILQLNEVSDRLQGTEVLYGCSLEFIKKHKDNERIMFYLDPPYLQSKQSLEDAEKNNKGVKLDEFNPGFYYSADVWGRTKHKEFLSIIKNAKAKMVELNHNHTKP